MRRIVIVLLLLLNALWFVLLCAIAMRGNLVNNNLQEPSGRQRASRSSEASPPVEIDILDGPTRRFPRTRTLAREQDLVQYDAARKNVAERLKVEQIQSRQVLNGLWFQLLVNFAQVNSMALAINTEWTQATERVLRILGLQCFQNIQV